MNILVTAGNTLVPIDKVRCITNIFSGATGAHIAVHGHGRGHKIILLTSHPDMVSRLRSHVPVPSDRWIVRPYQTFDDLRVAMADAIQRNGLDVLIHSAAVSDYQAAGIFAPDAATRFDYDQARWHGTDLAGPRLLDMSAAKVKSDAPELWLRLVRAPKLVDLVRTTWGFTGILVKFKLEVGVSEERLLDIAERSRRQSTADLMVANTLEGKSSWAYLGPVAGSYHRLSRREMPDRLFDAIDSLYRERNHG